MVLWAPMEHGNMHISFRPHPVLFLRKVSLVADGWSARRRFNSVLGLHLQKSRAKVSMHPLLFFIF